LPDKDRIIQSRKESSILYKSGTSTRVTQNLKQDGEESEDDLELLLKGDEGELSEIIEMNNSSPIEK